MKITQSLLALAICGVLFTSCKENAKDENDTSTVEILDETPAQLATASFTIEGMHCAVGCAGTIQKKLAKLEGVEEVDVDFDNKKATITKAGNKPAKNMVLMGTRAMMAYMMSGTEGASKTPKALALVTKLIPRFSG